MKLNRFRPGYGVLMMNLPGPDRKRSLSVYHYSVTYRNPTEGEPGCVITWTVNGGRLPYQVALERSDSGRLRWHCSCADSIYRGEDNPAHVCKHVRGLIDTLPIDSAPQSVPTVQSTQK